MALGIETVVKALLNAMGVEPLSFIAGMQNFINSTHEKLLDFDRRLSAMEIAAKRVEAKLDLILAYQQGKVIPYERNRIERTGQPGQSSDDTEHWGNDIARPTGTSDASG